MCWPPERRAEEQRSNPSDIVEQELLIGEMLEKEEQRGEAQEDQALRQEDQRAGEHEGENEEKERTPNASKPTHNLETDESHQRREFAMLEALPEKPDRHIVWKQHQQLQTQKQKQQNKLLSNAKQNKISTDAKIKPT
eukprot:GHVT01005038.1.p3 GENE.GHVT01005038.1~~GHVT01005038.1.p3  ORF type:complete len:138 (+),score=34.32 GHVT01005038.1:1227-1640(+)